MASGNGIYGNFNSPYFEGSNDVKNETFTGFSLTWGLPNRSFHKPTLRALPLAFSRWSKSDYRRVAFCFQ